MKLAPQWIERIKTSIELGDNTGQRIVLVNVGGLRGLSEAEMTRNIYRLNSRDEVVWQVSPSLPPKTATDRFVSLSIDASSIAADRFFGDEFEIDGRTGQAAHTGWHK